MVQMEAKEHKMPAPQSSKPGGAGGRSHTNAATRRAARGGTVGPRTATPSAAAGSQTTPAGSSACPDDVIPAGENTPVHKHSFL